MNVTNGPLADVTVSCYTRRVVRLIIAPFYRMTPCSSWPWGRPHANGFTLFANPSTTSRTGVV